VDVRVLKATTIPARHGQLLKLGLFNAEHHLVHASVPTLVDMDIMAAAVNTDAMGGFPMHIRNADYEDREIKRGTLMGKAHKLSDRIPINANAAINMAKKPERLLRAHIKDELEVIRKLITDNVNRTVPYQYRSEYITMLMARQHFFSADSQDLGFTDLELHTIDLKDKDPVFSPQFQLPAEHLKLIQENVAGWLQAGIIERSRSPYNSPIFCVPKKEGQGLRCVLDYRRVNSSSFSDRYALRTIDECLETVGRAGSKVYSALDCSSAFLQLQLRPSDRPFTAFTIPGKGQYHWRTCPQGLMGAPASFSRLMDVLLADAENVLTYIDDVLVHSQTHEQHLKHLAAAIDKIGTANLRLNPRKCVFGSDSVEYLGHTLSGDGVRPGQDKAKAMQSAQPPLSVKELRSFCWLANYFRSYIVQFAIKAAPLFRLTRQDSDWKGGELPPEASRAFLRLRDEIASRPVMAYPNATGQYHLFVDAALGDENNSGGLGAVLMQDQEAGLRKPVA
jgi:hypothetical protein